MSTRQAHLDRIALFERRAEEERQLAQKFKGNSKEAYQDHITRVGHYESLIRDQRELMQDCTS